MPAKTHAEPLRADPEADRPEGSETSLVCAELSWDMVTDCRQCAVRQQALFSALRGTDFEHIFMPIRGAVVPQGAIVYTEDQSANAVFTIRRGVMKLVKNAHDGAERIVRLLGQGAAIGLEAALSFLGLGVPPPGWAGSYQPRSWLRSSLCPKPSSSTR